MSNLVLSERDGQVQVITVNNPPVNALSPGVMEAIVGFVQQADADPEVRASVVLGSGRTFIAGFDIKEFAKITAGARPAVNLASQILAVENASKPVVMALHGTALGGGLEVAMGGHYRVALPSAQCGQPEVKLGLIPGAGGTQRLPRLTGFDFALEMCAFGEPVAAGAALRAGLLDELIEGDLRAGAVEFALRVAVPGGVRRTRERNGKLARPAEVSEWVEQWKARATSRLRRQEAPLAAIDAVASACWLDFAAGVAYEHQLFERLLHGEQSRALIHVFFGERAIAKIPGLSPEAKALPVRQAAVVGAGTMGAGIAVTYANAGIPVLLKDSSAQALERGLALIRKNYDSALRKGRLDAAAVEGRLALIKPTLTYDGFETADVVTEAVFEDLTLKKQVFSELDAVARPGAILATNTSTLDVDALAQATGRPEWVVGHHYFSPASVMRLLEVVRARATTDEVLVTSLDLARRLKKVAVVARNARGFIGNRMFIPYREQAIMLVEEGATPEQVDRALTDFGLAMGPFAVGDLSGLDVFYRIQQSWQHLDRPGVRRAQAEELLYQRGRYGQKTGAGWYRYDEHRQPHADPEVIHLVRSWAAEQGIAQHIFTPDEIVERCLNALSAEGKQLLAEGVALRPVDIDMVYIHGYGFPAFRGGPMFSAGVR